VISKTKEFFSTSITLLANNLQLFATCGIMPLCECGTFFGGKEISSLSRMAGIPEGAFL
jgi:hypothetical protein